MTPDFHLAIICGILGLILGALVAIRGILARINTQIGLLITLEGDRDKPFAIALKRCGIKSNGEIE